MKILFAVSNENISDSIIKKYQQEYREIISSKNVYYFNAIIKELQKDKSYDRIIISEDLEPFANNNYEVIDKFIFEKLDSISDEATRSDGTDIPIILICADRRTKSENLLIKLFGIGIYSALLGQDRSITNVCALLNKPRSKKEAKIYYKIEADNVDYKSENEGDVSEVEIQNILNHYKKLGKNEEKYVESFNRITSQYTDAQLRVICKFLPLNVKAVLEANSPKYQELITFGAVTSGASGKNDGKYIPNQDYQKQKGANEQPKKSILSKSIGKSNLTKPVIIPSLVNQSNTKKNNPSVQQNVIPNIQQQTMQQRPVQQQPIQQRPVQQQPVQQRTVQQQPMQQRPAQQQPVQQRQNQSSQPVNQQPYVPDFLDATDIVDIGNEEIQDVPERKITSSLSQDFKENEQTESIEAMIDMMQTAVGIEENGKKKRGRPKKIQTDDNMLPGFENSDSSNNMIQSTSVAEESAKKKRGRPRKVQPSEVIQNAVDDTEVMMPGLDDTFITPEVEDEQQDVNLFGLADEEENNTPINSNDFETTGTGGIILPGFEETEMFPETNNDFIPSEPQTSEAYMPPSYDNYQQIYDTQYNIQNNTQNNTQNNVQYNTQYDTPYNTQETRNIETTNQYQPNTNLNNLLTRDKKIVAFVGTSKNGTSFLVNNLADILSKKGINTAILDLTKNRNAYYIYTQNEESLRKKSYECISKLRNGIADGIQINRNLTVYTTLPDGNSEINDYQSILPTLAQKYSLVLMDCDFNTESGYFSSAQEIYLVQSYDILTIQPLTAFLRDLKSKNILSPEKLRVVLNKALRVRSVTERMIIGGMAYYNDPAMSFMTELFNKDTVQYCTIPFEVETYSRYLEGLVNCQISTNGYSREFLMSLDKLGNMVYPLLSTVPSNGRYNNPNEFSSNMNATLDRMKNNY